MNKSAGNLVPRLYYAVTLLFILLDYACHINVRVAILDDELLYKSLYYGFCILCGFIIYLVPRYSSVVALLESIIVIFMTVLGLLIPYIRILSQMDDILNADFKYVIDESYIINISMAGIIAIFTLRKSLDELSDGHRNIKRK